MASPSNHNPAPLSGGQEQGSSFDATSMSAVYDEAKRLAAEGLPKEEIARELRARGVRNLLATKAATQFGHGDPTAKDWIKQYLQNPKLNGIIIGVIFMIIGFASGYEHPATAMIRGFQFGAIAGGIGYLLSNWAKEQF